MTALAPDTPTPDTPVVIATPTIVDGNVIRWYRTMRHAELRLESVSASQNRVSVHDDEYQTLPQEWVRLAMDIHQQLQRNDRANVDHVLTHRRTLNGRILRKDQT